MTPDQRYQARGDEGQDESQDDAQRDGQKYEWRSWPSNSLEGMPPKRRRLAGWVLLWFLLLNVVPTFVLDILGILQPWRSIVFAAVMAAVFGPLIRGAVRETRALRADGVDVPAYAVTRQSVVSTAIITGLLWISFAALAFGGEFVFPFVPIACTVWLAVQFQRWGQLPSGHLPENVTDHGGRL